MPSSTTNRRLKPMRVSDSFRTFALEQLGDVKHLRARSMFGGIGLYSGEVFFGLIAADRVYLKVDDSNRRDFRAAGMKPFKPYPGRTMTMSYYEVPVQVLEDATTLGEWSRTSIKIARTINKPPPRRSLR